MQYVGSKNRISKDLAPIIQSYINDDTSFYIEPFVGGANMIDKIKFKNKIGSDIHEELIELLKYAQSNELPTSISEEEYNDVKNNRENYEKWYVGLVGFCGSFGAKYFGGYARGYDAKQNVRHYDQEAIRNLKKQSKNFKDIVFRNCSFEFYNKYEYKNVVFYCDIPYKNTTKYTAVKFSYEKFYKWCKDMSKNNIVLVSEYDMPSEDFIEVWSKEHYTSLGSGVNKYDDENKKKIEKLFKAT